MFHDFLIYCVVPETDEADYKYRTEIITGIVCAGVAITTFITVVVYLKM